MKLILHLNFPAGPRNEWDLIPHIKEILYQSAQLICDWFRFASPILPGSLPLLYWFFYPSIASVFYGWERKNSRVHELLRSP